MPKVTFLDSGVLIAAWQHREPEIRKVAMLYVGDRDRAFVVNDYLRLEVVPQATFHKKDPERQFMERFLSGAATRIQSSATLSQDAFTLACSHGLDAIDALHVAAAVTGGAREFVTNERPTSPIFRCQPLLNVTSILPAKRPNRWRDTKRWVRGVLKRMMRGRRGSR
jgi:predicted nucleic acid-binding protein